MIASKSNKRRYYRFDDVVVDCENFRVQKGFQTKALTPRAFDVLLYLIEHRGRVVEKQELFEEVWKESFVSDNALTRSIKEIRRTIVDDTEAPGYILTVPKRGYRFVAEVTEEALENEELLFKEREKSSTIREKISGQGEDGNPATQHTVDKAASLTKEALSHRTSSAEVIISEIKRHKRGSALAAAAVLVAVAALAFRFYSTTGGEAIDSVAILPFVNASAASDSEYISDGVSDSVISSLSRLPNMRVIAFNLVLRYKGQQVDPQAVGRELKVRAVLISRLSKQGDDLSINTELVDVRDGRRLWGEQYNRKVSDIIAVPGEIARQITEGLRLRLTGEEKKLLAKRHTENADAYLFYNLGSYYYRQNTKEGFEKSVDSFNQSIKIDPNYALAYAGLARTYQFLVSRGFSTANEYEQRIEWAALKALKLDETLAEAHVCLGAHRYFVFDWLGAEKEEKRALELDPNSSTANEAYSAYLRTVGRADEAIQYEVRARELGPDRGEVAFAYYFARKYDKAIELYRKVLEKKDNAHARILCGEAYVAKGMPREGVAEMQKGMELDTALDKTPERWDRYPLLAYGYAAAGRRSESLKILDEQQKLAKQRYVSPYNFAIIYTGLGDKDQAFEWLTKCVEQRTLPIHHLKSRPLFDPLRSDPRYALLLSKMNLTP